MTQEEKDILLKDLCARLPYGVKVLYENKVFNVDHISAIYEEIKLDIPDNYTIDISEVKPYLFPLSSMTEEQSMELFKLFGISLVDSIGADYIKINECTGITFFLNKGFDVETHLDKLIDWLNKNHFDWRDLIPMGLALDATDLNIY
jgi:DNA-binding ferritin-like protein (Dps family)